MTYDKFIQNILNTRGRFACLDGYHERHHIIPKCMNGSNSKDNLIDLYAREHFIAHKLLAEENPQNYQLKYAYWNMCQCTGRDGQDKYIPTPEEYEEARIFCHEAMSGENHPMYGKHHSENARNKQSDKAKERFKKPEDNPMYGKHLSQEARQILSEKAKERYKDPYNHLTGKSNKLSKIINQYNGDVFIQTWYGAKEIKRQLGIDDTQIIGCCKHKKGYKSAGGFVWYYADDPTQPDPTKIIPNKMIKEE